METFYSSTERLGNDVVRERDLADHRDGNSAVSFSAWVQKKLTSDN
jgi:hypothetical protein